MAQDCVLNDDLTKSKDESRHRIISLKAKIGVACVFAISFLLYRLAYRKYTGIACNIDKYHQITYEANRKLYHGWDNAIIGIGQLLMDGWVIFMFLYWLCKVKNMRFPSTAAVFFVFRAILLNMEKFPFPDDIVWHNPGFISLTVPYEHTRDFFYSGHTGTLTIISLELWTLQQKKMCAVCIVSLLYMVNMLTITRIHYSIDVVGALIFAPFWYIVVVKRYLVKFDYGFSVFFYLYRKVYRKCKGSGYDKHGSEAQLGSTNTVSKKDGSKDQKQNSVKINMNDQISKSHDFPYLNSGLDQKREQQNNAKQISRLK